MGVTVLLHSADRQACITLLVALPSLLLVGTWAQRRHLQPRHAGMRTAFCLCKAAQAVGQVFATF